VRSPVRLLRLSPDDPPDSFPDPDFALSEPNGLLAIGGDLSPARLLAAYRRGIFPWFSEDQPILWWSPDPRAVLFPNELHISRSLRRRLRSNRYGVSVDQDFDGVIRGCAGARRTAGTWLGEDMIAAYTELHRLSVAHSIEISQHDELVGGLYGVHLGGIFFGESMFSLQPDASKIALVKLAQMAAHYDLGLIDCQVPNDHLLSLGARLIPRSEFRQWIAALASRTEGLAIAPETVAAT
jgi:leucyl/phenylalanyl-tRNA--protein transferase